jgi:hypothetical protein
LEGEHWPTPEGGGSHSWQTIVEEKVLVSFILSMSGVLQSQSIDVVVGGAELGAGRETENFHVLWLRM